MNGSPCAFTPNELRTAVNLWKRGTQVKDISEKLGRNRSAVRDMLNFAGIKRLPGPRPIKDTSSPIGLDHCETRMREDAFIGSSQLLMALERTGLRP